MHDLCVPSIYSTHDFVSNVYSILGKEVTCDIRLFLVLVIMPLLRQYLQLYMHAA